MSEVKFYPACPTTEENIKYSVIAARYQDKWVFCRHKDRTTWEIPGGHREPSETPEDTARRELYEETGAVDADIRPVCYYSFNDVGMLFYANIRRLEPIPEASEIREVRLFDTLPENLTYPHIQPHLYNRIQCWLNLQSNAGELWDVYDENRNPTGRLHRRGDYLPKGDYHLVVHVWIQNCEGKFLITERSPNKGFPNMWEATGGSALTGDSSLDAALREAREETGLILDTGNGKRVLSYKGDDHFSDVWLFRQDFDLKDVVFQEGETCGAMYASKEEILRMRDEGKLVPLRYLDDLLKLV